MASMDRRHFLSLSAAAAAASALPVRAEPVAKAGSLRVVFLTDTHNQPELRANEGTALAMRKIRSLKPDLCLQGGDHVMDMTSVPRERSLMLLDEYEKTQHILDGIPVEHVIGNHDVFGRSPESGVSMSDPMYGKKAFEQRFSSRTYRSFDRAGYHFVLLDSIQITPEREFDAMIDPAQIEWLRSDLARTPAVTPIVVATHVPLVSAAPQYSPNDGEAVKAMQQQVLANLHGFLVGNSLETISCFEGHRVIAVLQGHTHINETVWWRNTPYITSGAVCGNWWRGSRWGTPEGFTVLELSDGAAHWRYETYGWRNAAPTPDPLKPISDPMTSSPSL